MHTPKLMGALVPCMPQKNAHMEVNMETEKEILYQLLQEIREEIDHNEREDGTYAFDAKRVQIALDFTKRELESSIADDAGKEDRQ